MLEPGDVADRWADAWIQRRLAALFRLMMANITIESNLDPDGDFVEISGDFVAGLDTVTVAAKIVIDNRVSLVYDCLRGAETFRLAEFLDVDAGLVRAVRRVYDLEAVHRLFPGLGSDENP